MRRAELTADEQRKAQREQARKTRPRQVCPTYLLTLDTLDKPGLQPKPPPEKSATEDGAALKEGEEEEEDGRVFGRPDRPEVDPIKDETLAILQDLIAAGEKAATAKVDAAPGAPGRD